MSTITRLYEVIQGFSEHAFVGAEAVANKDVKPHALMIGVPALKIGWMSQFGEQIPLPL